MEQSLCKLRGRGGLHTHQVFKIQANQAKKGKQQIQLHLFIAQEEAEQYIEPDWNE